MKPPVADVRPVETTLHGTTLVDPYAWLRNKEDPEVIAWLEGENGHTAASMAHTEPLQEQLYNEMLARIQEDDTSVPVQRGAWLYYTRTLEGKSYSVHCRKLVSGGEEQVLLDENALAEGHDYFKLGAFEVSPGHSRLAYTVDTSGAERFEIRFRDLDTLTDLPDIITNTKWSIAWGNDAQLFYTESDHADRPYRLVRHALGTPAESDVLVHEEPDERFFLDVGNTRDRQFVLLELGSKVTSELWFVSADDPTVPFTLVAAREQDHEYDLAHHSGTFWIRSNRGGATNFRLFKTPVATPSVEHWTEVIAHDDAVMLNRVDAFRDHLVLSERREGLPVLRVHELATGAEHQISFPEPAYDASLGSNPEFNTHTLRLSYTSLITPSSVIDYDMNTRERTLRKEQPVLGGYNRHDYIAERIWAPSHDGTLVPMSVVRHKDTPTDGAGPALLIGYGSYGMNYPVSFSSTRLSLLDRGFVLAIGHIRGGAEMGRSWYENGKFLHKRNTFLDFIACADHLVGEGYCARERLAIMGGSAGGLLMGATLNERPDVCGAVVAMVPFVDIINTMLDETLPLTVIEWEEWGNPHDATYFEYMLSYSPYDNVAAVSYPAMLVTAGLNDPRVGYWEPAKWVAKLRATKTGDQPLLLKTHMGAGHGGRSGRYGRLGDVALEFAFVIDQVGAPA